MVASDGSTLWVCFCLWGPLSGLSQPHKGYPKRLTHSGVRCSVFMRGFRRGIVARAEQVEDGASGSNLVWSLAKQNKTHPLDHLKACVVFKGAFFWVVLKATTGKISFPGFPQFGDKPKGVFHLTYKRSNDFLVLGTWRNTTHRCHCLHGTMMSVASGQKGGNKQISKKTNVCSNPFWVTRHSVYGCVPSFAPSNGPSVGIWEWVEWEAAANPGFAEVNMSSQ